MSAPCLHRTTRKDANGVLLVEIPKGESKFPTGTLVIIAPESDPEAQIHAKIWGSKRRYATIQSKRQYFGRFTVGMDVTVRLDQGGE